MKPLRDILKHGLKVIFIGYNPSLRSAELGHHYSGKSNRFWDILYKSGLTPEKLDYLRDMNLLNYGYGSTNIIDRPTKAADELTREEYLAGRESLKTLLETYRPSIACYVGIGVYKYFAGKNKVSWGQQADQVIKGITDFVAPSTSGLNRMPIADQLKIYCELNEIVKGLGPMSRELD